MGCWIKSSAQNIAEGLQGLAPHCAARCLTTMSEKTIVIVSISQEIIQAGFRSILAERPDFELAAVAVSQLETIEAVVKHSDPVVLVKHRWNSRVSCAAFCKAITGANAKTRIILLDVPLFENDFAQFLDYGVHGYLTDLTSTRTLFLCIESVARGSIWIGPLCETDHEDLQLSADLPEEVRRLSKISPREQEVFLLLAKGFTNQGIANCLGISKDTVKTHMHNIMEKFAASDRTQLVIKVRNELRELKLNTK
jgi:DNA-binding NarL/FixJ family response regulator